MVASPVVRKPNPEDVAPFLGRTSEQFADWLEIGYKGYLFEGGGPEAFVGAEAFIDQIEGTLASDLATILLALPISDQVSVRRAVRSLLQSIDFTNSQDAVLARELLELGVLIRAPSLPSVIEQKCASIPTTPDGHRLFAAAFDIACDCAFVDPEATARCIKTMVRVRPLFPRAWVGRALLGLTRAQPRQFSIHYEVLYDLLQAEYGSAPTYALQSGTTLAARKALVLQLDRLVVEDVALAYPCAPAGARPETNNWWMRTLEERDLADVYDRVARMIGEPIARMPAGRHDRSKPAETLSMTDMEYARMLARE